MTRIRYVETVPDHHWYLERHVGGRWVCLQIYQWYTWAAFWQAYHRALDWVVDRLVGGPL